MTFRNWPADGKIMSQKLRKISTALVLGTFAAAILSGCGRKGDPEAPGVYEPARQQDETETSTKPKNNNSFVLDPLL